MGVSRLIASIILIVIGLFFFFNNKNIGKGAYKFYKWFYAEKNLIVIFKIMGIILVGFGILLLIKLR